MHITAAQPGERGRIGLAERLLDAFPLAELACQVEQGGSIFCGKGQVGQLTAAMGFDGDLRAQAKDGVQRGARGARQIVWRRERRRIGQRASASDKGSAV